MLERIWTALHEVDPLSWLGHLVQAVAIAVAVTWVAHVGGPVGAGMLAGLVVFGHRELPYIWEKVAKGEPVDNLLDRSLDWMVPLVGLIGYGIWAQITGWP